MNVIASMFNNLLGDGDLDHTRWLQTTVKELHRAGIGYFAAAYSALEKEEGYLEWVAQRSYNHPNGFVKIILAESDEMKVRLHYWHPTSVTIQAPHNHRWPYAGVVLDGAIAETIYMEDEPGNVHQLVKCVTDTYCSYDADTNHNLRLTKTPSKKSLRPINVLHHAKGVSYVQLPSVIHAIERMGRGQAATLICTGRPIATEANVYLNENCQQNQLLQPPSMSEEAIKVIMGRVLDAALGVRK